MALNSWLWVAIEPLNRLILGFDISMERHMFAVEKFIAGLTKVYDKHSVSTDGGTWYPQVHRFLKLIHYLHSSYEKSIIERTMQYIKDRTENFDDYFPCKRKNCKLKHVMNWMNLFVDHHNSELKMLK